MTRLQRMCVSRSAQLNRLVVLPTKHISTKAIETWINQTLDEAELMNIPGVILKVDKKKPIVRYGVDRYSLTSEGLSKPLVNRLYRALFVYSIGFNELMQAVLKHTRNNYGMTVAIWKVFCILLEFS